MMKMPPNSTDIRSILQDILSQMNKKPEQPQMNAPSPSEDKCPKCEGEGCDSCNEDDSKEVEKKAAHQVVILLLSPGSDESEGEE